MKNEFSFLVFAKKHWWLILSMALLLVVPVFIYCCVFYKGLNDVSAWASMIAGIATYLGTAFLGILVYYNSWVQTAQQEKNEELHIDAELFSNFDGGHFFPFAESELGSGLVHQFEWFEKKASSDKLNANYLQFNLSNYNPFVAFSFSIEGVYFVDKTKISKIKRFKLKATKDPKVFLDYKEKIECFVGCSNELLRRDYYKQQDHINWFVVLKIRTSKNKIKYLILDYVFGKTFAMLDTYLDEKTYDKRIKENGCPIRLTRYNKQFFKTS